MKKFGISFLILAGLLLIQQSPLLAVGSVDLIEKGARFDNKTIDYEGEVIREAMVRGDHAWLNVNDGTNALGIWVKSSVVQNINNYGSYQTRGDWITVSGIFHRSCPEHGGDMDIHAVSIKILKKGDPIVHPIHPERLIFAILIVMLGVVLFFKNIIKHLRAENQLKTNL